MSLSGDYLRWDRSAVRPTVLWNTIVCYSLLQVALPAGRAHRLCAGSAAGGGQRRPVCCCMRRGTRVGYVCAPSLFQRVAARCAGQTSDITVYQTNRDLLYNGLTEMGYRCVKPQGAFTCSRRLWSQMTVRSVSGRRNMICWLCRGRFRRAGAYAYSYCVQTETIRRALPLFKNWRKSMGANELYKFYNKKLFTLCKMRI